MGDGGGYIIRRGYKQQASLINSDGKAITTVDLDRGTFLPLDAYSDKEIEGIADDSFGERRRSLLDELESGEPNASVNVSQAVDVLAMRKSTAVRVGPVMLPVSVVQSGPSQLGAVSPQTDG